MIDQELPPQEGRPTDEDWRRLETEYKEHKEKYQAFLAKYQASIHGESSFYDIVGNLLNNCAPALENWRDGSPAGSKSDLDELEQGLKALDTYYGMLESNPGLMVEEFTKMPIQSTEIEEFKKRLPRQFAARQAAQDSKAHYIEEIAKTLAH